MNRILCYLGGCGCQRRERDRERLQTLAAEIETCIDLDGVVHVSASRSFDDPSAAPRLTFGVCLDWTCDHERTAREEIGESLENLAHQLLAAVARLEGGAA